MFIKQVNKVTMFTMFRLIVHHSIVMSVPEVGLELALFAKPCRLVWTSVIGRPFTGKWLDRLVSWKMMRHIVKQMTLLTRLMTHKPHHYKHKDFIRFYVAKSLDTMYKSLLYWRFMVSNLIGPIGALARQASKPWKVNTVITFTMSLNICHQQSK